MAEETQVEVAPEAEGMAALGVLTDTPAEEAVAEEQSEAKEGEE